MADDCLGFGLRIRNYCYRKIRNSVQSKSLLFNSADRGSSLEHSYTIAFEDVYVSWNPTLIVCIAILAGMIAFNQIVINWAQKKSPRQRQSSFTR